MDGRTKNWKTKRLLHRLLWQYESSITFEPIQFGNRSTKLQETQIPLDVTLHCPVIVISLQRLLWWTFRNFIFYEIKLFFTFTTFTLNEPFCIKNGWTLAAFFTYVSQHRTVWTKEEAVWIRFNFPCKILHLCAYEPCFDLHLKEYYQNLRKPCQALFCVQKLGTFYCFNFLKKGSREFC